MMQYMAESSKRETEWSYIIRMVDISTYEQLLCMNFNYYHIRYLITGHIFNAFKLVFNSSHYLINNSIKQVAFSAVSIKSLQSFLQHIFVTFTARKNIVENNLFYWIQSTKSLCSCYHMINY